MTDKKTKIEAVEVTTEVKETPAPAKIEHTDDAEYRCVVIVNGETLLEKRVPLVKQGPIMKTIRAAIRSRGLTITKAVVTNEDTPALLTKTITFTGVEMTAKPIRKVASKGSAQAEKDYTASNEVILGIVHDPDVSAEDKEEALLKQDRFELIAASKANGLELKPRSTKKTAVAALLGTGS